MTSRRAGVILRARVSSNAPSVTSLDVARLAGVSQSTVSLVLSGKGSGRASAEVQERVRRAAAQLRYRPHPSARALRSGRTQTVGLFVPDVTNSFLGRVLRGAQQVAREELYTVALVEPGEERGFQLSAMDALRDRGVDGLLLFSTKPPRPDDEHPTVPVVLIEAEQRGVPSVTLDVAAGTAAAMEHLLALGHRAIAHLGTDIPLRTFAARGRGWRRALSAAGISPDDALEAHCAFALEAARAAARGLLEAPATRRPTAIFCDDDLLAAGARLAAADLGIDVPRELSLVGFAGTILSEAALPQLTTVTAPAEELGADAMRKLLALLRGGEVQQRTVLPVSLTVRDSTAAPAAGARARRRR
jgi:LacI family transcriptional regulator, repressor for deo operon, udp, cdd, tsx, nupC, and nupG